MEMNLKRMRGRHDRRTNITGYGAGKEHSRHAVKMNFKLTWADATEATGNASTRCKVDFQGVAIKMNFKRQRGRRSRRGRQRWP